MGKVMKLSAEQRRDKLLETLLTSPTVREAARAAGISERSAYEYLEEPGFKRRYQAMRDQTLTSVSNKLRNSMDEAVDTVLEIMRDGEIKGAYHRMSAARLILEMSMRSVETVEIVERMSQMEKRMDAKDAERLTN